MLVHELSDVAAEKMLRSANSLQLDLLRSSSLVSAQLTSDTIAVIDTRQHTSSGAQQHEKDSLVLNVQP